jgi:NAD(P)-dependent dehydrogenase (short-subunit alcohol dehydrogenase family)
MVMRGKMEELKKDEASKVNSTSRGIGRAIALRFAKEMSKIVVAEIVPEGDKKKCKWVVISGDVCHLAYLIHTSKEYKVDSIYSYGSYT